QAVTVEQGCPELMPALKAMYNGYRFGAREPVEIYNPWSTLSCIADRYHELIPYWHKSGSPELLHRLVLKHAPHIHNDLKTLMAGQTLQKQVSENIQLRELGGNVDELFGFMLFAGYLKAMEAQQVGVYWDVKLKLVNRELEAIFDELYRDWFRNTLGSTGTERLVKAVLEGDVPSFQLQLEQILRKYTSFMDGAGKTPEHFYQGLMLGLMVLLRDSHTVLSNLEVGLGRADLQLIPKKPLQAGVVMELKVVQKSQALLEGVVGALQQLEEKHYETLLESQEIPTLHRYGLAFNGKEVRVAEFSQLEALKTSLEALKRSEQAAKQRRTSRTPSGENGRKAQASAPLGPTLTLEERLDLEDLVLPHLTSKELERMWLRLNFLLNELPREDLSLQWEHLLTRCTHTGQLASLSTLIQRQLPALKDHALIQKLRA
ncbi:MAG: PD-(D/E)XK nuclease domain-containing protein, partial [Myxococcota bacterium]